MRQARAAGDPGAGQLRGRRGGHHHPRHFRPHQPSVNPGQEQWRVFLEMARRWRDVVNRRGGNVTLVHLPGIGVRGNTHFPMSDINNLEIADLLSKFLKEKGLD